MANDVFANGREIACKAGEGKSICAFPDVCFTPPENPATPPGVPVPYPNTGFASDTTNGTRNVKISGKEVMRKNVSYYKKSTGDEAGCAAKKGVITSVNRGKVYFKSWSMDVKFEGKNVTRHLDVTTHNHASDSANENIPWPDIDTMAIDPDSPCAEEQKAVQDNCPKPIVMKDLCPPKGTKTREVASSYQKNKCLRVLRCRLVSYEKGKNGLCCPDQVPDHLIEASAFGKGRPKVNFKTWTYDPRKAPCMCVSGHAANVSTHGILTTKRQAMFHIFEKKHGTRRMTIKQAASIGAVTASHTFKNCSRKCLESQLLAYHKDENQVIEPPRYGASMTDIKRSKQGIVNAALRLAEKFFA